jgi:succinate-semialdehyde dehydrogenase/glutarate-semialdehyde dehydrogenase
LGPYFYEPTILEGVNPEMKCFGEETFGPVISLYRFTDEADAIARANQGEYGLNGSIYSRDTKRARAIAKRIKCGTVNVNEAFAATFASMDAPMGGMRESGIKVVARALRASLRYTETQSVAVQYLLRFGPQLRPHRQEVRGVMTANLKLLKKPRSAVSDFDFDVVVVGSGFGGSVSALRLTEKGYRVAVIEAGPRFEDKPTCPTPPST